MASKKAVGGGAPDEAKIPLYQLVARTLQTEIVRGVYLVGSQLPSEAELMQRFSVGRHTIRAAVLMLQNAGLVKTRHGLGSIVQSPTLGQSFVHEINTISDLFPLEAETRYDPVESKLVRLPRWARFFPGVDGERTWLHITGDRRKPGAKKPFNEVDAFVASRFAGVSRLIGLGTGSIYTALEIIYGEMIVEVEQVIGGFEADGVRGARIGLQKGQSGIEVRRLHRVQSDNDIAILTINRFATTDYTFSMVFRRSIK